MKIKRLIERLAVVTMLLSTGGMLVSAQTENTVQAAKSSKSTKVKKSKTTKKTKKKSAQIKIDSTKKTKKKAKLKVKSTIPVTTAYVGISDPSLRQDTINAINAWNATKAVSIVIVNRPTRAYINITSGYFGETGWAGETYTNLGGANTPSLVLINTYYTNQLDQRDRLIVVEHELGHALGLNHIDSRPSVMNTTLDPGSAYEIQPADVTALKSLYHEK